MGRARHWTAEHQSLIQRAAELEAARRINIAAANARVVLYSGDRRFVDTRRDFEAAKKDAKADGRAVDPRFQSWLFWERTAAESRAALTAMYPPEDEARIRSLALGDARVVGWALVFLEADPQCFRAGYVRERLLRYLARIVDRISDEDRRRVRTILVAAVDDPWRPSGVDRYAANPRVQAMRERLGPAQDAAYKEYMRRRLPFVQRREFRWYCRLAAKLGDPGLRGDIQARLSSADEVVMRRALLMIGAIDHRLRPAAQA